MMNHNDEGNARWGEEQANNDNDSVTSESLYTSGEDTNGDDESVASLHSLGEESFYSEQGTAVEEEAGGVPRTSITGEDYMWLALEDADESDGRILAMVSEAAIAGEDADKLDNRALVFKEPAMAGEERWLKLTWMKVKEAMEDLKQAMSPTERTRSESSLLEVLERVPSSILKKHDALNLFLKLNVGIQIIRKLVDPSPPDWFKEDCDGNYPLHLACQYSSVAVTSYIFEKIMEEGPKESQLQKENGSGHQALHCALLNSQHVVTADVLFTLAVTCNDWKLAWELSLATNQPLQNLDVMVEILPNRSGITDLDLDTEDHYSLMAESGRAILPFTASQAVGVARLTRKVKSLGLYHPRGWDVDAFMDLLNSVTANDNLYKLEYITLPRLQQQSEVDQCLLLSTLESFLQNNTYLTNLSFNLNESDPVIWNLWVKALERGLGPNNTMRSVRFNNYYYGEDGQHKGCQLYWETTKEYTSRRDSGHCLHLLHNAVTDDINRQQQEEQQTMTRRPRMEMEGFELSDSGFLERLKLSPATTMDALELDIPVSSPQSSAVVIEFLQRAGALTKLELSDCHFDDIQAIFFAIRDHPSLRVLKATYPSFEDEDELEENSTTCSSRQEVLNACLDLVQNHNLNLVECSPWSTKDPRIQHYLLLNLFGRDKVMKTSGTGQPDELLKALESVGDDKLWEQYSNSLEIDTVATTGRMYSSYTRKLNVTRHKAGIAYGLLRMNPGLWLSCQ